MQPRSGPIPAPICTSAPFSTTPASPCPSSADTVIIINVSPPTPKLVNPSIAHFWQKYITLQRLGAGDNGETYSAISKETANKFCDSLATNPSGMFRSVAFATSDIIVGKFAKEDNLEGDLTNEIKFMTETMKGKQHYLMTSALDSHHDGNTQWLALPYCSDETLERFAQKYPEAITESFVWHVGFQLAETLSYLLFGVTDISTMTLDPSWPSVYHADVFTCNILLRPHDCKGAYPYITIADFGRATELRPGATVFDIAHHQYEQLLDLKCIWDVMSSLCNERGVVRNDTLKYWSARFGSLGLVDFDLSAALPFLKSFMETAVVMRDATYQPMPENAVNFLANPGGSEELATALREFQDSSDRVFSAPPDTSVCNAAQGVTVSSTQQKQMLEKQVVGQSLFPKVLALQPDAEVAGRVIGILIQAFDADTLLAYHDDATALAALVELTQSIYAGFHPHAKS